MYATGGTRQEGSRERDHYLCMYQYLHWVTIIYLYELREVRAAPSVSMVDSLLIVADDRLRSMVDRRSLYLQPRHSTYVDPFRQRRVWIYG